MGQFCEIGMYVIEITWDDFENYYILKQIQTIRYETYDLHAVRIAKLADLNYRGMCALYHDNLCPLSSN